MTIKMLKPRVQTMPMRSIKPLQTERLRGSSWMKIRDRIMRRDNGLCRCDDCVATGALRIAHQIDHIIELADGGTDADVNLRAVNFDCHARKSEAAAAARRAG